MTQKYGYSQRKWDTAREEMRRVLIDRAKQRSMITYTELVQNITTISLEPESYALAKMLGEISRTEDANGRGMLTVIVVHKIGDMQPGPGFFKLVKELGRNTDDTIHFWVDELKQVFTYWSQHNEELGLLIALSIY